MTEPAIITRLEATLERMRAEGVEVRSINLSASDRALLNRRDTAKFNEGFPRSRRMKLHVCAYNGHPVRDGLRSIIYSKQGVGFYVRRLPSPRTQKATK